MDKETLQQYIEGKLNQQQKDEIARWLDADEANMQQYRLLRYIYDATIWNAPEARVSFVRKKHVKILWGFLKIASIFILALACSYYLLPKNEKITEPEVQMQTVYSPEGQRTEIYLADGTRVWLNARTSLTFPTRFTKGERRVELNGEAFFDVQKDSANHFIVSAKDYRIKVLGTEFNVKAYHQNNIFETALLEGAVEVISPDTRQKVILDPQTYVYEKDGKLIKAPLSNVDQFLWKEGIISFENESVKNIFTKLELYFDTKIEVRNTKILDFPYTGKFRTKDGVEHVLKVLQLRHKFKYIKNNESNTIVIM